MVLQRGPSTQGIDATATRVMARMAPASSGPDPKDTVLNAHDQAVLKSLRLRFHPVWNIQNNMITGYRCVLCPPDKDTPFAKHAGLFEALSGDVLHAKIDMETYAQATRAVRGLLDQGFKAIVIVPIHFSTLDNARSLAAFLESGGPLSDDIRALLVFELRELPAGITRFRLRDPVSYLRGRSRALVALTDFNLADGRAFQELNFHSVGVDLSAYPWSEKQLFTAFERFVKTAQAFHLHPFVHGVTRPSTAVGAVGAGFTYIDGPAIAASAELPSKIQSFSVQYLYEPHREDLHREDLHREDLHREDLQRGGASRA